MSGAGEWVPWGFGQINPLCGQSPWLSASRTAGRQKRQAGRGLTFGWGPDPFSVRGLSAKLRSVVMENTEIGTKVGG